MRRLSSMASRTTENVIQVFDGNVFVKTWRPIENDGHSNKFDVPIVLLHDSLGCVGMWRDFPAKLANATGREVVAYDRLGYGKSSARNTLPSLDFIKQEAEEYLPRLLGILNINKCILFGHSVGGGMAITAAAKLGDRCEALVSESAQAFVEERTREGIRQAQKEFANPSLFAKLESYHKEKTQWVLDAWIKTWLSQDFSEWSLRDVLPKVKSPLLVVHGEKDEYGSSEFPNTIEKLSGGPTKKLIIPNCGHVPHRENEALVLELVAHFLGDYKSLQSKI